MNAILIFANDTAMDKVHRQAAVVETITRHGGELNDAGKAHLAALFDDAGSAVRAAVAIQQGFNAARLDAYGPKPGWRIAVAMETEHASDVIARAKRGRVCATAAVVRQVGGELEFGFAELPEAPGEPSAYYVFADPATAPRRVWLYQAGPLHNAAFVLVLLLLVVAIGVFAWPLVSAP